MAGQEQTGGSSFDDLYEYSRAGLARQLYALTGNWDDAYDHVQEAFVRCWTRWDRISTYNDPEAYVRRVAYNLAKSRWRTARRVRLRATTPERQSPGPDPAGRLDLVSGLQALTVKERTAIALHYLGGLSIDETAAEMGVPAGTVKSSLSRGRTHLAARLVTPSTTEVPDP